MPKFFIPLLILSVIICCVEVEISVPGFPAISEYFQVSDAAVQLTVALNFLGFCLASFLYGPLSESFGRRPIMLIGNGILLIGACGCAFASTIELLLLSRFIQGLGASTSAVVAFAMIADSYERKKATRLLGIMNSIITIIMALAPVIGGFINESIGWRGNYSVIALVSILSWLLLFLYLPETNHNRTLFGIKNTLKDFKKLLTHIEFISASTAPSIFYSAYMAFVACAPFLYIEAYQLSVIDYAIHQGCIVLAFSIMSFFVGKISKEIGETKSILIGMSCHLSSTLGLLILGLTSPNSPILVTLLMSLFCIGSAMNYPIIFSYSLNIFPSIKGTASSLIMSLRALLCALFIAAGGYLYQGRLLEISLIITFATSVGIFCLLKLLKAGFLQNASCDESIQNESSYSSSHH